MYGLDGKQMALIAIIIGAILFGAGYKTGQARDKAAQPVVDMKIEEDKKNKAESEKSQIAVYVSGAVKSPGIYHLSEGARVADAVYRAVPLDNADLDNINLAEPITDGQQIQLYVKSTEGAADTGGAASGTDAGSAPVAKQGGKVNINRATLEELDALPGIGPSTAQKIIDYRKEKGRFKSVDELTNVTGIGEKKLESIRKLLTI